MGHNWRDSSQMGRMILLNELGEVMSQPEKRRVVEQEIIYLEMPIVR